MRCKVGDMAIITGTRACPENLGKSVDVVEYLPPGSGITAGGVYWGAKPWPRWVVASRNGDLVIKGSLTGAVMSKRARTGVALDDYLTPIRPDSTPIETTTSTGEPA